jgi:hypothetical protein
MAFSSSTQAIDGRAGAVARPAWSSPRSRPVRWQALIRPARGDDRRAVLVVMEDRDVHQLAQALLDDEALRRLDVLEVDAAEGRRRDSARS